MPEIGNTSVWSQTDASNNSGTMPSWDGAASPDTIDNAGRAMMGAITREWNWRNYTITAGGTANAKTLTYSVAPAAYYDGQRFAFISNTINTGSATLNVNSVGAKTIKFINGAGTATTLVAGQMPAGQYVEVTYNQSADAFIWVNYGALRGLMYLAALSTGSGNSVSLTGIPSQVRAVYCEVSNMSLTTTTTMTLAVSNDNSVYGTAQVVTATAGADATTFTGAIWIDNIQSSSGSVAVRPAVISGSNIFSTILACAFSSGSGPLTAIKFATSSGSFDAGSINVWGLV